MIFVHKKPPVHNNLCYAQAVGFYQIQSLVVIPLSASRVSVLLLIYI